MPQANNNPCPKNVLSAHPQAKLSGEHVWSEWMALFPGPKTYLDIMRRRNWVSSHLNWKAKVVCITCNNGWMIRPISHTENLVARLLLLTWVLAIAGWLAVYSGPLRSKISWWGFAVMAPALPLIGAILGLRSWWKR